MTVSRTGYNNLQIHVYEPFSTTIRDDPNDDLLKATILDISTYFPGGRFGTCRIYVPRDVTRAIPWNGTDRVEIRNALDVIWEGEITNINYTVGKGAEQGILITANGYWGTYLDRQTTHKVWADVRVSPDVWRPDDTAAGADMVQLKREGGLLFMPKNEEWAEDQTFTVRYTMPTGQTIKRIKTTRTMIESAEITPRSVVHHDGGSFGSYLSNMYDDDTGTSSDITLTSDDYLYVNCPYPYITGIRFDLGASVNNNVATMSCQFFNGEAWEIYATITDNTDSGGATFAVDGTIDFGAPVEVNRLTTGPDDYEHSGYWVRFSPSANLDIVTIKEIYVVMDQEWALILYDPVGTTNIWQLESNTSASADDSTLGTPRQYMDFRYRSKKENQRPPNRELFYAELTSIEVYSETGNINVVEIVKDVGIASSKINSDESYLDTPTNVLSLVPFLTNGPETRASIMLRAASYGDEDFNSWEPYLLPSVDAATPAGTPVLALKQYPDLSDYDYAIRIDESNVIPPLSISRNFADIVNWVSVIYRDAENNRKVIVTADDDANLKDTDSSDDWWARHLKRPLNAGQATATMAKNLARRVLAARKDPSLYMQGPIKIAGYIRAKSGDHVPAANIRAGKRIKIENFLDDVTGEVGAGMTFIITGTKYDDRKEVCSITTGIPDVLAAFLAQQTFMSEWIVRDRDKPHDHFDGGGVSSV